MSPHTVSLKNRTDTETLSKTSAAKSSFRLMTAEEGQSNK